MDPHRLRTKENDDFLKSRPQSDGRGVVMVVMGSGVDPSVPGLQRTVDGKRKLLDLVDCTGSGDVDIREVRRTAESILIGKSGRKLKIPEKWCNPSGEWHVGVKPIFELLDPEHRPTIKKERLETYWKTAQSKCISDVCRRLNSHKEQFGRKTKNIKEVWDREELIAQKNFLDEMDAAADLGPVADCIVWHDGVNWIGCIDTSFCGDLSKCTPMYSFKEKGEWGAFTGLDELSYSFRIHPNADRLEIVTTCGFHGTHVASTAASHNAEKPHLSGLAPGVQIVSLCIVDRRLDQGGVTGTSLIRAFSYCAQMDPPPDIISCSLGEQTAFLHEGRVLEELKCLVNRTDVIFVAAAGSDGPRLSTVKAPGNIPEVITVGNLMTPELAENVGEQVRTLMTAEAGSTSSRGPCADGSRGVSICAPGTGYAGLGCRKSAKLKGSATLMATSNAAGAIACLLSAAKQENLSLSLQEIRTALENTAVLESTMDPFAVGSGLIKVDRAYDYILKHVVHHRRLPITHFETKITDMKRATNQRAIFFRDLSDFDDPAHNFSINVTPKFCHKEPKSVASNFALRVRLKLEHSSEGDPVTVLMPKYVTISGIGGGSFQVCISTMNMTADHGVYLNQVLLIDEFSRIVHRIPITIIRPIEVPDDHCKVTREVSVRPGVINRNFFHVPTNSTALKIRLSRCQLANNDGPVNLVCQQNIPDRVSGYRQSTVSLDAVNIADGGMEVEGGKAIEVSLFLNESALTPVEVQFNLRFYGISVQRPIKMYSSDLCSQIRIKGTGRPVHIEPKMTLDKVVHHLSPVDSFVGQCPTCEGLVDGREWKRLLLIYNLKVSNESGHEFQIRPMTDYLCESPIDCIFIQIYDKHKRYIAATAALRNKLDEPLPKGDYEVHVQFKHHDSRILDGLKQTALTVISSMKSPIGVNLASSLNACFLSPGSFPRMTLFKNQMLTVYASHNLPNLANVPLGSVLKGKLTLFKNESIRLIPVPVDFCLTHMKVASDTDELRIEGEQCRRLTLNEVPIQAQIQWLKECQSVNKMWTAFSELSNIYPDNIDLPIIVMKRLDEARQRNFNDQRVATVASKVLQLANMNEVQSFFATNLGNLRAAQEQREMETRREAIIQALICRANALGKRFLSPQQQKRNTEMKDKPSQDIDPKLCAFGGMWEASHVEAERVSNEPDVDLKEFDEAVIDMYKWIGATDPRGHMTTVRHAIAHNHLGKAANTLHKYIANADNSQSSREECSAILVEICIILKWTHVANRIRDNNLIAYGTSYRLF